MPGQAFIEDQKLRAQHRKEIYPHGYRACRDCSAGEGKKCMHKSGNAQPLKNPHKGRSPRKGFGFEEWKNDSAKSQ